MDVLEAWPENIGECLQNSKEDTFSGDYGRVCFTKKEGKTKKEREREREREKEMDP